MPLKAATESRRLRLSLFTVLYFIQGIPSGLFLISLPGWFASNGLGKLEIGKFIAFTTLPWSFKFFFAPLMDRFHFLKMGRRRPWIITTQLGILVSTILMAAVPDPLNNLWWLSFYGFLVNLFSSIQDLAVDGMSVDVLPQEDRATAQGFMVGGQAIGRTLVSAGGALILFRFGYFNFIMLTGIIAGLGMLFPVFVR
jgi:PAT family beta-lactamase induction signal transducer AmpG